MSNTALPVAYCFSISFAGDDSAGSRFWEVSGLQDEPETQSIVEGGENRFVHRLPTSPRRGNLKLKHGVVAMDNDLVGWCKSILEGDLSKAIEPKDLKIDLLDGTGETVRCWIVGNACPVRCTNDAFNDPKNELAVESIEFAYETLKITA